MVGGLQVPFVSISEVSSLPFCLLLSRDQLSWPLLQGWPSPDTSGRSLAVLPNLAVSPGVIFKHHLHHIETQTAIADVQGGQTATCIPLQILQHVQAPSHTLTDKAFAKSNPENNPFSTIFSAALQMLSVFQITRNPASLCSTPVRLEKQGCSLQHFFIAVQKLYSTCTQPHQSSTLWTQFFPGNQSPAHFFTPVPRFLGDRRTQESQPLPSHNRFQSCLPVSTIWWAE